MCQALWTRQLRKKEKTQHGLSPALMKPMEFLGKETFIREKHTETSTEAVVGAVRGMILHGAGAADLSGREKGCSRGSDL